MNDEQRRSDRPGAGRQAEETLRRQRTLHPKGEPTAAADKRKQETDRARQLRQVAQEALRESASRYHELFEVGSDAIVLIDNATGNILEANSAVAALYGYDRAELLTKRNTDLSAEPEETQRVTHGTPIISDQVVTIPLRFHRKKDGTVFPVEITGRFFIREGRPVHIAAIRDITERKRAEEALRESEEKHRTLFETMTEGVVYQDADGQITNANPAAEKILGLSLDQMQGRTSVDPRWRAIYEDGSDFPGETHPAIVALRTGREVHDVVMGVFHPAKEAYSWIMVNAVPQFHPDEERPHRVYTTFDDITERKNAEDALRESEERYRRVVDTANEGIWIADQDYHTSFVNRRMADMLGYQPEGMVGRPVQQFLFPEDLEDFVNRTSARGKTAPSQYERRFRHKDGSARWTIISTTATNNAQGEYRGSFAMVTDITERKQAEEALRESEAQYRLLADHMEDQVWLMDLNLKPTYISPSVEKSRGYTFEEIAQLPLDKQLTATSFQSAMEFFSIEMPKALADPTYFARSLELEFYRKDGSTLWLENMFSLIWDENGKPLSLLGVGRDITERKKAEETIKHQLAEIASYYDNAPIGLAVFDADLRYLRINRLLAEINGVPVAEYIGKTIGEIVPTLEEQAQQVVRTIITTGKPVTEIEFTGQTAAQPGVQRVWQQGWYPLKSDDNRVIGFMVIVQDITERRQAEEALQESEERYRNLFETMTEGVVLIAPDGQILKANFAAERILRLKRSEIEGRQYDGPRWELLRPDGTPIPPEETVGNFPWGGIRPLKDVEIGIKHSDGLVSWITVNATPLLDQAGEIESTVGTFRDITEWGQLKREMARKITGELTAGIAHQIRNPLFVISLSVQSIEKKLLVTDPQRKLTRAILDKVHKLDTVTADLVHLGKYHRLHLTNASLRRCLEQALILVRAPAKAQRVKVVRRYYPDLPRAWIDVEAMDEVFANLLTNALEAMLAGGLLTVETDLDQERKELLVRIRDNGCGISKDAGENIFIPFSTTKESGSGLGLVFCQRIVEEHGGRLTFQSEAEGEDHGTTFQIALPLSWPALGRQSGER